MKRGMLCLTRKIGQYLTIGDDVEIHIAEIRGNQVKLSIHAPRNVAVHRSEIHLKIQREKAAPNENKK